MENIKEIFKVYGIKKAYLKEENNLKVVIKERNNGLSFSRWLNFINALKSIFHKEVEFVSYEDALKLYKTLDDFTLLEE